MEPEKRDEAVVKINKTSDTALLLCSFGSTYELPQTTYEKMIKSFKAKYPGVDIYLSFTSRTCVSRVGAKIHKYFAQPDLWLKAIGKAGYKVVGVQSLHVIPGEEYLSLMNTDVKKNFMIPFSQVKVAKGACLLATPEDVTKTAEVLYNDFCKKQLETPNTFVVFMGHGNPDTEYQHANNRYSELQTALQSLDGAQPRIFVGTVDYGEMMFSALRKALADASGKPDSNDPSQGKTQIASNGFTVHLIPLMSVAGDHAHIDMAGDLAQGKSMADVDPYEPDHEAEFSWKLKLRKLGYTVNNEHCHMTGLGDFERLRDIWVSHLDFKSAESWNEHLGEGE